MSSPDSKKKKTSFDIEKLWLEEIVRETDHYYQGEMQQEERGSWLLATASALMAIFLDIFSNYFEKDTNLPKIILLIPIGLYFLSAVIVILGIMPYRGTKGIKFGFCKTKELLDERQIFEFINSKFYTDDLTNDVNLKRRILFHFRSHYIRNLQKSQKIVWSAIFLLLGLLTSVIVILYLIFYS